LTEPKTVRLSRSWVLLACITVGLELFFVYEAVLADIAGVQRVFGVFAGLAFLCFAALLYVVSMVVYT
jgi:predicted Abi (CAAX) family protease